MSLHALSNRSQQIGRKLLHVSSPNKASTMPSTNGTANGTTNGHVSASKALAGKGSLYSIS